MRVLHCSDVHVTQDYSKLPILRLGWRFWVARFELVTQGRIREFAQAPAKLRALCREAERHRVEHLVLSGDLTASATAEEFRVARQALGAWAEDPRRLTVIPGNHDCHHPAALREKRFEQHFGPLLHSELPEYQRFGAYPLVRLLGDEVAVVALHSSRLPEVPGISYGRLGTVQLAALRELLGDPRLANRAVLVVVHHAPLRADGSNDKLSHRLVDAKALLELLPGPRFAVLHGHIHRRYHHPATERRPHLFCAGSSTQEGREGYWLIEARDGRVLGGTAYGLEVDPRER